MKRFLILALTILMIFSLPLARANDPWNGSSNNNQDLLQRNLDWTITTAGPRSNGWWNQTSPQPWQHNGIAWLFADSGQTSDKFGNAFENQNWLCCPPVENTGWNIPIYQHPGHSYVLSSYYYWGSYGPYDFNGPDWFHEGWDFQIYLHGNPNGVGPCHGNYIELQIQMVAGSVDPFGIYHFDSVNGDSPTQWSYSCGNSGTGYHVSIIEHNDYNPNRWYSHYDNLTLSLINVLNGPLTAPWDLQNYGVWYITGGMFGLELGNGLADGGVDYAGFGSLG